jgi:hypothetical protein
MTESKADLILGGDRKGKPTTRDPDYETPVPEESPPPQEAEKVLYNKFFQVFFFFFFSKSLEIC